MHLKKPKEEGLSVERSKSPRTKLKKLLNFDKNEDASTKIRQQLCIAQHGTLNSQKSFQTSFYKLKKEIESKHLRKEQLCVQIKQNILKQLRNSP